MTFLLRARRPRIDPDAPSRRHRLALAGSAAGGVAMLAALVARLGVDEHWPIDHTVRAAVGRQKRPRLRKALKVIGSAGTVGVYAPATALAMALVAKRRGHEHALPLAGAVAAAAGVSWVLKRIVRRPRPVPTSGIVNEKPGFPSGHATRATAAGLAVAYVLVRERMAPRDIALPLAASIAIATGVSRTYADAHWTTDVVGGWALGTATASGAALWYELIRAGAHDA
jgi:undecaprenyl-diphosphatase